MADCWPPRVPIHCASASLTASQRASAIASASANDSHALMYSCSRRICSVTPSGSKRHTRTAGVALGPVLVLCCGPYFSVTRRSVIALLSFRQGTEKREPRPVLRQGGAPGTLLPVRKGGGLR